MSSKPNLVYIASIGRSGSTLLESMLGAHPEIATMGELHLWPHELRLGGVRPCSCGESVLSCPFWSEVRRRADPLHQNGPGLDFFREAHDAGRTLRLRRLRGILSTALPPNEAAHVAAYGQNSRAVVEAFIDVYEDFFGLRPRWVVDASKDPYRLLWLARSGLFNLKVIHLVKNPCGFVFSATRPLIGLSGLAPSARRWYFTARQATAWAVQNHLLSQIARHHVRATDYVLVRYEDLASAPQDAFARLCTCIGCAFDERVVEDFRTGCLHTIAGNPMRYETRGIELDERWKTMLPPSSRLLAELMTTFTRKRYGYR